MTAVDEVEAASKAASAAGLLARALSTCDPAAAAAGHLAARKASSGTRDKTSSGSGALGTNAGLSNECIPQDSRRGLGNRDRCLSGSVRHPARKLLSFDDGSAH